jgi:ABC-2 type transport system ATP-binding protein
MRLVSLTTLALVAALAVPALAVPAQADAIQTGVATSFDGTPIVYTLFLPAGADAAHPVPAVLMTHGWAGSRATSAGGLVGRLLDAGFAVLTWDSRGFGQSGGFVELDSPAYEVRDASALIDLLAANPAIAQSGGDPVVGMAGGSYAGGIQLLTAAFDPRVDAIVPDITWNDLRQSLGPGGVAKEGWIAALFGAGAATGTSGGLGNGPAGPQATSYDLNLPLWYAEVHAANGLTPDVAEGLRERSAAAWMGHIHARTLLTQGLPDTLFNANEAVANWKGLLANGNPASLMLYCGGHAGCPYAGPGNAVNDATVAWLRFWLQGTLTPAFPAPVSWQDNTGAWHAGLSWPPVGATWQHAHADLRLVSTPAPTGGGGFAVSGVGGASAPVLDDGVGSAVVPVFTAAAPTEVSGIGKVHLSVSGVGTEAFLFFRLVDATSGVVLDGQTQAFRMPVSPLSASRADVDLVGVDYVIPAGHTLALQVSTSDASHATNRQPGVYDVALDVDVPTNA